MKRFARRFVASKSAAVATVIFIAFLLCAVFAPVLAWQNPYDLARLDIMESLMPPGSKSFGGHTFWFGTDAQGRDLVSAVLYGLRINLAVALASTLIALAIGVGAGLAAAHFGGRVDALIMRLVDLQLAFPSMLTALVLVALLGSGIDKVIIALVAAQWAVFARTLRSSAMVERTKEYIQAAQSLQYSPRRIMFRHLLPNSVAPLAALIVVEIAVAVSLEATLSFLGVGLSVTRPSLGLLIANGYSFMLSQQYWMSFFPGMVLLLLLVSINVIGNRLRQLNDPRAIHREAA